MGVCVVCGTRTGKNSGKSFHKFPFNKNPTVAENWVNWVRAVKRCCWTPCKTSIICSDHFAGSAFDRSTFRVELNINSVPTIFQSDNKTVTDTNSAPEIQGGKPKSSVNNTDLESPLNKCREDNLGIASEPSALKIFSTPVSSIGCAQYEILLPCASLALLTLPVVTDVKYVTEVLAVKRKASMHEICIQSPLKKHCGDSSAINLASVTVNCTPDSTALEIHSTPAKFPPEKALDESDVTPKTSIAVSTDECRTGRRRSLLFHDHNYENTPRTYRKKNNELKENLNKVRTMNKAQQKKIKKLKKQVESLKDLVGTLRKEGRVCTEGLQCLDSFSDAPRELCMRMMKNRINKNLTREKYPPQLRCFALTLHFYSPKAYDYVERTFDLALPHPTVLRKWYSSADAEPGFIAESFETLQNRVKLDHEKNKHVICSLMLDEMGIKMGTQCKYGTSSNREEFSRGAVQYSILQGDPGSVTFQGSGKPWFR